MKFLGFVWVFGFGIVGYTAIIPSFVAVIVSVSLSH